MDESILTKKAKLVPVLLAVISGIIFDYLFYGKSLGFAYPLYIFLMLCLFWWSAPHITQVDRSFGWFVVVPVFLLSATFALFSNPVLRTINFLLVPLLFTAHTVLTLNKNFSCSAISFAGHLVKRMTIFTLANIHLPFIFTAEELSPKETGVFRDSGKKVLIGILISVPVLFVIIPLLASADLVFNHYLSNITKIGELINFRKPFSHGLLILFVSLYVFGYMWSFKKDHPPDPSRNTPLISWDSTIILTVLFIINSVYLIFSVIQVSYLYGAGSHSLPAGFTYAEYARRGFFELVAVTVFNLSILLLSLKFVKKEEGTAYKLIKIALTFLVLFSLNLLFSANFKMLLYEEAYGLTYLRFFVHYFMGLLLVLFLLTLGRIWLKGFPLVKSYIITGLVFYTALNFVNVDTIIAKSNINMYHKTGSVDIYYLQKLSYDAVPQLIRLANDKNPNTANQIQHFLTAKKEELSKTTPWQSFNYSRYKASQALKNYSNHTSTQ